MKPLFVIVPKLKVNGMAIFPFILVKNRTDKTNSILINHEKIHLRQQLELLILPFYLLYFLNYVYGLAKYKNHYLAYYNIIFEQEAYKNESNLSYLQCRNFWAWLKFLTEEQPKR
jgi:hypothetical protein